MFCVEQAGAVNLVFECSLSLSIYQNAPFKTEFYVTRSEVHCSISFKSVMDSVDIAIYPFRKRPTIIPAECWADTGVLENKVMERFS